MKLPKATRNIFLLSGFIYVFAAAGIESIEGHLVDSNPTNTLIPLVTTTVQELFEMLGIILFIYGLVQYIGRTFPRIEIAAR